MKLSFVLIMVLLFKMSSFSQLSKITLDPVLVEVHFSFSSFDLKPNQNDIGVHGGIGLSFIKGLTSRFDWQLNLNGTYAGGIIQTRHFVDNKDLLLTTIAAIRARMFNRQTAVQPYAVTGLGFSKYEKYYGVYIPTGVGLQVSLFKNAYLLANSQYHFGLTNTINSHFYHSIGLAGTVSRKKLTTKTKPKAQPQIAVISLGRDSDNDGIPDSTDACPEAIGVARYHGCPVPDKDKDGINDEEDKCIDVPGIREYAGCPPPKRQIRQEIKTKVDLAAKAIYFETGSAVLLPASDTALNEVVKILKADSNLKLTIEGHTDNVGTPAANEELSQNRAQAVLNFLKSRGITEARLGAKGFGQNQPIADNSTEQGRAINRRVELKLIY